MHLCMGTLLRILIILLCSCSNSNWHAYTYVHAYRSRMEVFSGRRTIRGGILARSRCSQVSADSMYYTIGLNLAELLQRRKYFKLHVY